MHHFSIIETDGTLAAREPTVGKWYAAFNGPIDTGILAEYVGDGCFCDEDWQEDSERYTDVRGYVLAEQA